MIDVPEFAEFFRALNRGRDPFPWQSRLALTVAGVGWPAEIGIPTGLGKTACIDVAVWALARQSLLPPAQRTAATRTWYVVNRRLLVDAAFDHGCRISVMLENPSNLLAEGATRFDVDVVTRTARALDKIGGGVSAGPLQVTRLRGGAELGARPSHPAQPAIIFSTVPMFASRWMFRGFGTSSGMSPVDAALAGADSLVLLDEAHLTRPLLRLAGPLSQCDPGNPGEVISGPRSRPVLVSLTATGEAEDPFSLDEQDLLHPVVRRRLDSAKPIRLAQTKQKTLVTELCHQLSGLLAGRRPSEAVVFVNSPTTAREVFRDLQKATLGKTAAIELLTGRIREREGAVVRARLLDPMVGAPSGRPADSGREKHLIVVATQTLEVGADLDFDVLVTEACGTRALIQRLGRLNRLGERPESAGAVVFARDAKVFGIYGEEPKQVWDRLVGASSGGAVDLSPAVISDVLGQPMDSPEPAGELLPAHLWEWAKTTNPPVGEAPSEIFFSGFDQESARVSVAWRQLVPGAGEMLVPPLSAAEAVEIPLWEAREIDHLVPGGAARLSSDRATIEFPVQLADLRPGDQLLLPTSAGGYDRHGWEPQAREPILDLSLLRPPGLPLDVSVFRSLMAAGEDRDIAESLVRQLAEPPVPDEEIYRPGLTNELVEFLKRAGRGTLLERAEWERLIAGIRPLIEYPVEGLPRLVLRPESQHRQEFRMRSDVFDELNFTATSPKVSEHLGAVGELAGKIAASVGVPESVARVVAAAGRFHDLGKNDVRFQRWLDPLLAATDPVAKSDREWQHWGRDRISSGWPKGGRHEELSRRLVAEWHSVSASDLDLELLLHLVVSHHGHGRPLLCPVADGIAVNVDARVEGLDFSVPGDLSLADWDQPARFRRCCERYGVWGLALLEAIVRQADHEVSKVVVL